MSVSKKRFSYLFWQYFSRAATPKESEEFYLKLSKRANDKLLSRLLNELWKSPTLQTTIFSPERMEEMLQAIFAVDSIPDRAGNPKSNASLFYRLGTAAALILAVSVVFFFQKPTLAPISKTIKRELRHDMLPGGSQATLTLSNGRSIKLDSQSNGVLSKFRGGTLVKAAKGQLICALAAPGAYLEAAQNIITTPKGGQYQIFLADGTKVWLNAASSLRFPVAFTRRSRIVELTGEAYFEVAKNLQQPFTVKTPYESVQVLGTHFNIMTYPDEPVSQTTLMEGSVSVSAQNRSELLTPGQQAVLNKSGGLSVRKNVDGNNIIAWKNGNFSFKNTDIQQIMRQISRWYDVSVTYQGEIPTKRLTGSISRNVNASELLSVLSYTGIHFKMEDRRIIVLN